MKHNFTTENRVGNTSLHKLKNTSKNKIFLKMENMNPSGQFNDRVILASIKLAQNLNLLNDKKIFLDINVDLFTVSLAVIGISKGFKIKAFYGDDINIEIFNLLKSLDVLLIEKKFYVKSKEKNNLEIFNFRDFLKQHTSELKLKVVDEICRNIEKIDYLFLSPETSLILNNSKEKLKNTKIIQIFENKKLENNLITEYLHVTNMEGIEKTRDLLKEDGLLLGLKSGKIISGCQKFIKENNLEEKENLNIVIILEDSILNNSENILNSKNLLSDEIICPSYFENKKSFFGEKKFSDYENFEPLPFFDKRLTIGDCFDLLQRGFCVIPLREPGRLIGIIDEKILLNEIMNKKTNKFFSSIECMQKEFLKLDHNIQMSVIEKLLETEEYVLVVEKKLDSSVKNVFCVTRKNILGLLKDEMKEYL